MQRAKQALFERGGLITVMVALLYVWVAPTHIVDGDNAEFVSLGTLGGAGHPSGYPSYVLWLRLWSWLPLGSPAHRAALATVALGVISVAVLHAAARAWGARPGAATIACALFAGAPVVLSLNTEAEVFAGNGLVLVVVLWLAAEAGPRRGVARAGLLGLVAGLGLANHLTCVLLAPVGLLGVLRGVREETSRRGKGLAVGAAGLGLVVGLTPYLYLLVAPEHQATWSASHSLSAVLDRILRKDYGGPGTFAAGGGETFPGQNLRALAETLGRSFLWVPALAGLAMLGVRSVKRPGSWAGAGEPRAGWWCLAASFLVSGPLLVYRFNLPAIGVAQYVVERFHLMPVVLLAIPVALAIDRGLAALRRPAPHPAILGALATLGFAAAAGLSLPHLLRAHVPAVEYEVRNMLETAPPNAVIVGRADDLYMVTNYLQAVEHVRTDITYVQWSLMNLPWYFIRVEKTGVTTAGGENGLASQRLVESAIAAKRPVLVDVTMDRVRQTFHVYPYGLLFKVVPPGQEMPDVLAVLEENKAAFGAFQLPYARPGLDDEWPTEVHRRYQLAWTLISRELARQAHPEEAAWAAEAAREYGPKR